MINPNMIYDLRRDKYTQVAIVEGFFCGSELSGNVDRPNFSLSLEAALFSSSDAAAGGLEPAVAESLCRMITASLWLLQAMGSTRESLDPSIGLHKPNE
jgi:hypothetical protein